MATGKGTDDGTRPLFTVPAGLVRILDRDLLAADIDKADERGRSIDVHALPHSFGTLLSKGALLLVALQICPDRFLPSDYKTC